jgi:hypothetical protein
VAVLIVALVALRNPHEAATSAGSNTATGQPAQSTTASRSPSSSVSSSASTSPKPSASHRPHTVVGSQPLIVVNQPPAQNDVEQAAQRFRAAGWHVASTNPDYINDVLSTTAYYDPDVAGAKAAALALQNQFPTIKRVLARFPQLPSGPVVVVLTSDYSTS